MANEHKSLFGLFNSRRFLPFFLTQFSGALNDNLFKNALLVVFVSSSVAEGLGNTNTLVNIAAGLFILPFFLFSPLAGQFADKYDKAKLIRRIKLVEIIIMVLASAAWWSHQWWALMALLFAMGTQSAFFGPIKYSIIPQHLADDELVSGNAQVEMGTFVAILLGTIGGTLLAGIPKPELLIGGAIIVVAILGWWASQSIPPAPPKAADLQVNWNPFSEAWALYLLARERRAVLLSIVGISWFWLLGASYLTQMPNFAVSILNGSPGLIATLLCGFVVGIATGSLLCDRLSGHKIEIGLVPLASIGLSVFGIDLYFSTAAYDTSQSVAVMEFLTRRDGLRVLLDIVFIGLSGGLYIVPLYANVQTRTDADKCARVIAFNNILNAIFMVVASIFGVILLGLGGIGIPEFFLIIALMNIAVAVFIYSQVPEFTMRFLVWLLSHTIYRVKHQGLESIPEQGPALIASNHVSFIDALLIAGAVRRPVRFIMYKPIFEIPVLNFIFRTGGAIPICSPKEDEGVYLAAMDAIAQGLEQGDLLCIFPEGKLSRDGEIDALRPGIMRMIERSPAPVVPMALRGLWGGFFSHSDSGPFKKPFRRIWSKIDVVAAPSIAPEDLTMERLTDAIQSLRGDKK
ncbi:MAG: MFS transporter [Porticoccaceae bacterium]